MKNSNKNKYERQITYGDRCERLNQLGHVIWLTGLSGAGKSTIAINLEKNLFELGQAVYLLDGDILRNGINEDLGFSEADRNENVRRISEIAALFKEAGFIVIVACISPFIEMRLNAMDIIGRKHFSEVYISTSLEKCIERDVKGLYKAAIEGKIQCFTGISSPYESPEKPDIKIDTVELDVYQSTKIIMDFLRQKKIIKNRVTAKEEI